MSIIEIREDEFEKEVLKSEKIVLVDFYANWCGPCKMLSPIMDDISTDNKVYKVNVDKEESLAREYGVMSIPCVVAFKDGKEINRSVGLRSKDDILELIK